MGILENHRHPMGRIMAPAIASAFLGLAVCSFAWPGPLRQTSEIDHTITSVDLLKAPGKLIAQGTNTEPTGALGAKTYRLERIDLVKAINAEVNGQVQPVKKVFRLTIATEPFPVRAIPPVAWIGAAKLDKVVEGPGLDEFIVFFFDESVLRDGAAIAIGFGDNGDSRTVLKEKLNLGAQRRTGR